MNNIDVTKPIQTQLGKEARYMGRTPDGLHVVAWKIDKSWEAAPYTDDGLSATFENVPPPRRKKLFWIVWNGDTAYGDGILVTLDRNLADYWSSQNCHVSEHLIAEPPA